MVGAQKRDPRYRDVLFEVVDQVAWVTINRPHVLNACRELTLDEITDAIRSTRNDPSIACAVITGVGDRAFCVGGDFKSMMRLNWVVASHWNERMLSCAMTIRGGSIPVIAMVNGWCMGGGHELALWCDIVVASENAVFGQTGARVGACPTVGQFNGPPRDLADARPESDAARILKAVRVTTTAPGISDRG
jgi:enoyl-CoA hydratase/carnithine racemase